MFYYVYVFKSKKDNKQYVDYTNNIKRRLVEHNKGLNFSTSFRRPFITIFIEACLNKFDAKRREKYLKTTQGRRFLGLRLKQYYKQGSLGNES